MKLAFIINERNYFDRKSKIDDISNIEIVIGENAYCDRSSLTQIIIQSSNENNIFRNCSSSKQITIPLSMTSIKNHVFFNCKSLKEDIYKAYTQMMELTLINIKIPSAINTNICIYNQTNNDVTFDQDGIYNQTNNDVTLKFHQQYLGFPTNINILFK